MPDKRAETVADTFYRHVVLGRMCPESVHVDRGGEWYASFAKLCRQLGIKIVQGAARSPWVQGLVERANQQLEKSLGAYQREHGAAAWEKYLPNAVFALRVAKQRSTGLSPFKILYGIEARLPQGLQAAEAPIMPITVAEADMKKRRGDMQKTYEQAVANDQKAKERQAKAYNKRCKTAMTLPEPGTVVRLAMPAAGSGAKKDVKAKLTVPVQVVAYPNDSTVTVKDGAGQTWNEPLTALRITETPGSRAEQPEGKATKKKK